MRPANPPEMNGNASPMAGRMRCRFPRRVAQTSRSRHPSRFSTTQQRCDSIVVGCRVARRPCQASRHRDLLKLTCCVFLRHRDGEEVAPPSRHDCGQQPGGRTGGRCSSRPVTMLFNTARRLVASGTGRRQSLCLSIRVSRRLPFFTLVRRLRRASLPVPRGPSGDGRLHGRRIRAGPTPARRTFSWGRCGTRDCSKILSRRVTDGRPALFAQPQGVPC